MSWKGIKRAAARTPHMIAGNKSADAVFESLEKEFTFAIAAVDKIIAESKGFRDSWTKLLSHQHEITNQWSVIYASIPGEQGGLKNYYETPKSTIAAIDSYSGVLGEVKETLLPVLNAMDGKVIQPAMEMKKQLEQIQKLVKKRHHKKMDYDRFTQSVEKLRNKKDKTEKDVVALQKMEQELEEATQLFQMHDEEISQKIPLLMDAISTFFTPILSTMYAVQSDLYQHLYASVHEYATSQGLTETDSVVEEFVERYEPKRQEAEGSIKSVREGKTGKTPYGEANISKPGIFARKSSGSGATVRSASSKAGGTSQPAPPPYTPDPTRTSSYSSYSRPSPSSVTSGSSTATLGNRPDSVSASDPAKQKRPPPPPPPKPSPSPKPEFVVAIYDFAGENAGDLSFRAGDRIKIIKKTNSLDDWWQGEVNGTQGSFPRNYCE